MRIFLLAVLCAVALKGVVAESENEVKRGTFSFMAFVYYPDETITENGARFTRSAALISNDWLISSSDVGVAFPQETLLARLGAVNIDKNFTLNEDEDEQEREIILILRPYNISATQWWKTDISLMKTLFPFNTTPSVAAATLVSNPDFSEKKCYILVYARSDNGTERALIQMNVELLQPTIPNCGNFFAKETMVCAADNDTDALEDPQFCQGNRGGPLVCDNELTGLQTYINDCKQPYLYQLVNSWKKLIACAVEERYLTPSCENVYLATSKDPPSTPAVAQQSYSEPIGELVADNIITELVDTGSADTQRSTDATEATSIVKVEEQRTPTVTTETESIPVETKLNEEQSITTNSSPTMIEKLSSGTTTTEVTYYAGEESLMDSTDENYRKNQINAQHQLTDDAASQIIPKLFHYVLLCYALFVH